MNQPLTKEQLMNLKIQRVIARQNALNVDVQEINEALTELFSNTIPDALKEKDDKIKELEQKIKDNESKTKT